MVDIAAVSSVIGKLGDNEMSILKSLKFITEKGRLAMLQFKPTCDFILEVDGDAEETELLTAECMMFCDNETAKLGKASVAMTCGTEYIVPFVKSKGMEIVEEIYDESDDIC